MLSDRLDRLPVGNDNAAAFAHLEQRVSYLLERARIFERSTAPAICRGSRTACRTSCAISKTSTPASQRWPTAAATSRPARIWTPASPISSSANCPISAYSQTERDRHTQDSLEAVHNTLGHVVDRLAMIEGDLRTVRAAPPPEAPPAFTPRRRAPQAVAQRDAMPPQPKPELPNPAAMRPFRRRAARIATPAANANFRQPAPREFEAAPRLPCQPPRCRPPIASASRAISEILEPHIRPGARRDGTRNCRRIIRSSRERAGRTASTFGADRRVRRCHQRNSRSPSPSPRPHRASLPPRAAPPRPPRPHRPMPRPSRQACQGNLKRRRRPAAAVTDQGVAESPVADSDKEPSTITSKIRVAAGRRERGRDRARHLQDGDDAARRAAACRNMPAPGHSSEPPAPAQSPPPADQPHRQQAMLRPRDAVDDRADADRPAILQCIIRQSDPRRFRRPVPAVAIPPTVRSASAPVRRARPTTITGTDIPVRFRPLAPLSNASSSARCRFRSTERLPDAIGGPALAHRRAEGRSDRGL